MLQGFEKQTAPLNDYERDTLLPLIVRGLKTKIGEGMVIASSTIIRKMKAAGYKLDGPRLRKIINHIRNNDIIPGLVSNSNGYYVATTVNDYDDCISSLQGRVNAIQANIDALTRQRNNAYTGSLFR